MSYYFSKTVTMNLDHAVAALKEALEYRGFRVLTEIDMKANFRKALGVEFRPYLILGVCNPELTFRALQVEDKVGTMLPCNIVLQQHEDSAVEIAVVDPLASMQAIANVEIDQIAQDTRALLLHVIDDIEPESRSA